MKQYIKDLENMDGTWEEDFKKAIEKANPDYEEDFISILRTLSPESIPEYLGWMINMGNANLVSKNIDSIMQIASNYRGNQKIWIDNTINLLKGIQDNNINESISNNLLSIIRGPYTRGNTWFILELCKDCKDIGNSSEVIDENYEEIIDVIFSHNEYLSNNLDVLNRIKALILKLAKQENVRLSDIKDAGSGHYSDCMQIGTIILKFGRNRILEDLPVHKRILQPKLRINIPKNYEEQIEQGTLKPEDLIAIECQDIVYADWYKDLTKEQIREALYTVYRDVRKDDYIWVDIKPENVGRLLKPNIVKYTIQDQNGENVEMQTSLPIGELVIFDTDRIYKKDKLPQFNDKEHTYKEFEERYIEEQERRSQGNELF